MQKQKRKTDWKNTFKSNPSSYFSRIFYFYPILRACKRLLTKAQLSQSESLIELGAGTGFISFELAKYLSVKRAKLIDLDDKQRGIWKKLYAKSNISTDFVIADLLSTQVDCQYDLVMSTGVIEHFDDQQREQLIKLHADFVKPGGYCIIFVPTPTKVYKFFRKLAETLGYWRFFDETPLTKKHLIEQVKKAGLQIKGHDYFWRWYLTEVGIIAQKPKY